MRRTSPAGGASLCIIYVDMLRLPETQTRPDTDWELLWSPYDEATYKAALECVLPDDIILDIGAGDFRLAERMAAQVKWVFGIEIQEDLMRSEPGFPNVTRIYANALAYPFPEGITAGVLLMRHCRHFRHYADKLKTCGARRLITNARWGMGVEEVDLSNSREPYAAIELGWFACWCGNVGFKPGEADRITPSIDRVIYEVVHCPLCQSIGE